MAVGANNHNHHVAADSCMEETEFVPVVREVTAWTSEGSEIGIKLSKKINFGQTNQHFTSKSMLLPTKGEQQ